MNIIDWGRAVNNNIYWGMAYKNNNGFGVAYEFSYSAETVLIA